MEEIKSARISLKQQMRENVDIVPVTTPHEANMIHESCRVERTWGSIWGNDPAIKCIIDTKKFVFKK